MAVCIPHEARRYHCPLAASGMQAELRDIERAVAAGTREAGRGPKTELRRQVGSAGLGQRLANSWRDRNYPTGSSTPRALCSQRIRMKLLRREPRQLKQAEQHNPQMHDQAHEIGGSGAGLGPPCATPDAHKQDKIPGDVRSKH
jgi:hypothetical protein